MALGEAPSRVHSYTVLAPIGRARAATEELTLQTLALVQPGAGLGPDDLIVHGDQLGDGYGVPTAAMFEAVRLLARHEGLLLDPVYSGKAFAGLIAAIQAGRLERDRPVLFIMTGGIPGLFAYEPAFREVVH